MSRPVSELPAAYRRAVRRLANQEIDLDWAKVYPREPPMWPGMLCLWSADEAVSENARLEEYGKPADLTFIGTNTCGLLWGIDGRGQVVAADECEVSEDPTVMARDFETLLTMRVTPTK